MAQTGLNTLNVHAVLTAASCCRHPDVPSDNMTIHVVIGAHTLGAGGTKEITAGPNTRFVERLWVRFLSCTRSMNCDDIQLVALIVNNDVSCEPLTFWKADPSRDVPTGIKILRVRVQGFNFVILSQPVYSLSIVLTPSLKCAFIDSPA